MDSFNKENFIYIKNCSITKDFCGDIISLFDNSIDINDMMSQHCSKLKKIIIQELQNNIHLYTNRINKNFIENNQVFQHLFPFNLNDPNSTHLKIMKTIYTAKTKTENFSRVKKITTAKHRQKHLQYMWFLNDYDGEICFWNYYKIKPKAGLLMIFPTSWMFPYNDLVHPNITKYTLYGNIF